MNNLYSPILSRTKQSLNVLLLIVSIAVTLSLPAHATVPTPTSINATPVITNLGCTDTNTLNINQRISVRDVIVMAVTHDDSAVAALSVSDSVGNEYVSLAGTSIVAASSPTSISTEILIAKNTSSSISNGSFAIGSAFSGRICGISISGVEALPVDTSSNKALDIDYSAGQLTAGNSGAVLIGNLAAEAGTDSTVDSAFVNQSSISGITLQTQIVAPNVSVAVNGTLSSSSTYAASAVALPISTIIETAVPSVYVTDRANDAILRHPIGSTTTETVLSDIRGPRMIAIDENNRNMYIASFSGEGGIVRADLDGNNRQQVTSGGRPFAVALDQKRGKLYWSDHEANTVLRANLNGTDVEVILDNHRVNGIGVKSDSAMLYILQTDPGRLTEYNLDGSLSRHLIAGYSTNAFGLSLSDQRIWWADLNLKILGWITYADEGLPDFAILDPTEPALKPLVLGIAADPKSNSQLAYWVDENKRLWNVNRALDVSEVHTFPAGTIPFDLGVYNPACYDRIARNKQELDLAIQDFNNHCGDGDEMEVNLDGGTITYDSAPAAHLTNSTTAVLRVTNGTIDADGYPRIFSANGANLVLENTVLTGANGDIGVVLNVGGGSIVHVINSTITGNTALFATAIYNSDSTVTLTNSTVSNNTVLATSSSAIRVVNSGLSASLQLNNSIIANTFDGLGDAAFDCRSDPGTVQFSAGTSNLIENDINCGTAGVDYLALDPNLGPLADNGGVVQTMLPLLNSPVFDAGNDAVAVDAYSLPLVTDTRGAGFSRFIGTVDLGAAESPTLDTPQLLSLNPADNASDVSIQPTLQLVFNESMQLGAGTITVHQASDDAIVASIDVSTNVTLSTTTVNNDTVSFIPTSPLSSEVEYYVLIPAGAIIDLDDTPNSYGGIQDTTQWSFSTAKPVLNMPASASMNESGSVAVTITRSFAIPSELTVALSSSDTSLAEVPATVTINANSASTTFVVNAVDDLLVDGNNSVVISASADDHVAAQISISIIDDDDSDNDSVSNTLDNCPLIANPDQADFERDGIGDVCDSDDDGDGMSDDWELANGLDPRNSFDRDADPDGDGFSNREEHEFGTDPQQPDADDNGNGIPDEVENRVPASTLVPILQLLLLEDGPT